MKLKPWISFNFILLFASLISGCAELGYYSQAARGQLALITAPRPVEQVLQDPQLDSKLRQRLELAQTLRQFAVQELALPDNASYRSYVQLDRPYVLWNVVATPELSLQPLVWCFPVAGCVSYRGYYSQAAAQEFAASLRASGHDVQVSGTPAYSTLGWFSDPLLSSFIHYGEADLARLMFHELAHQRLYIAGDAQWNESFATSVELAGTLRWLHCKGDSKQLAQYHLALQRQEQFLQLLREHRQRLLEAYQTKADAAQKRAAKQEILQQLHANYAKLKQTWAAYTGYDRWFAEPVGNAHLVAVATYHDGVPALTSLLRQQSSFSEFYRAAQTLAQAPAEQRQQQMRELASKSMPLSQLELGPCSVAALTSAPKIARK